MEPQTISVVIPCYNTGPLIRKTAEATIQVLEAHSQFFDLILVDDGSQDGTWQEILQLTMQYKSVQGISLGRNQGEHRALYAGLGKARGDFVFTMDDDLQHDPADIPRLVQELKVDADVVYGVYQKYHHSLPRRLGSLFNGWTATLLHKRPLGLHLSSLRGFSRRLLADLESKEGVPFYLDAFLLERAQVIETVPITHRASELSLSRYSLRKLITLYLDSVRFCFSQKPKAGAGMYEILSDKKPSTND